MQSKAMRDVFLASLHEEMAHDESIFFVAADFGSPILDKIRADYPARFINVGIAEQNLINVATGLALEGFKVFAYAIAPFITMRCYEQIRVNIAILSQIRDMNINIIGVGAGVSYAMSGPTHHCLEDLSIMRTLPNIEVFSPSDYVTAQSYVKRALKIKKPKYIRFDAQPLVALRDEVEDFDVGFSVLKEGERVAILSTGYMTHKAVSIAKELDIKLIDIYLINSYDKEKLQEALQECEVIFTLEEAFKNSGGLDAEINFHFKDKKVVNLGFEKKYTFEIGSREFVHQENGLSEDEILKEIKKH
ncbi:MAG: transketolase [Candidatus Cloacimonetes bacterium]|nr:transketolase [Candidatus Cloacimonadota bacterium]